jgi:hypothetical protein
MQAMLDHHRRDRWDLNHLMAQGLWIISPQQLAATAASIRVVLHHLIHPLDRQQLRPGSWMARLSATLAATTFTPLWRLKPRTIAGGRFRGVARAAADPLPQAGQFGGQGSELSTELLDLLLLLLAILDQLKKSCPFANRCSSPVRF